MKTIGLCLVLFAVSILPASADLPFFDDTSIQSLQMVKEMHSKMTKDGELFTFESPSYGIERGGEKTKWISMYIDIQNERIAVRWVDGVNRPENFLHPDQLRIYKDQTFYDISHQAKRVYIDTIDFRQLTSYFSLGGWFYDGINLSKTVSSLSSGQLTQHEEGIAGFWLRKPQTQYPAQIFINEETQRVVKVQTVNDDPRFGGDKIETEESFEWANVPETDFWYPKVIQSHTDGTKGIVTVSKTWVRAIQINPDIPSYSFNTDYPEDYTVIDRRNLLKPPRF